VGRVLVEARVDPARDVFGELSGAEAVGELWFSEVLDDGVDDLDREGRERGVSAWFLR
jgi:hypothetical protein